MARVQPDFSVIIPVFNGELTLARAIDSVLAQTCPAREIIVVDDGSTDGTREVIETFGNSVRYLRQANAGVSAARNAGAAASNGSWLAFLDADDYYYPDRLERHATMIRSSPDLDFLTGDFDYLDWHGGWLRSSMDSTRLGRELRARRDEQDQAVMHEDEFGTYIADHFGDMHTLSVPKRTFEALGGFSTRYRVCEDVHLLVRLCARSRRCGVFCKPLGAYVIHGQSATRRTPVEAQRQTVAAFQEVRSQLANNSGRPLQYGVDSALRTARLNLAYSLLRHGQRREAIRATLPLLACWPYFPGLKAMLSVAKGLRE